jgi:hypothetical protein
VPVVVQYNKRDLEGVLEVAELARLLGIPRDVPAIEASAKFGRGVFDTLKAIVRECLKIVGDPRRAAEGRTPSILPGHRASMYPGALIEARESRDSSGGLARDSGGNVLPRAPRVPSVPESGSNGSG